MAAMSFLATQHDATYLVMVASWSEAGGSSTLTITASEVGVLMKKSDADIIWFYRGEPDESGMLTASLNFPEPITPTCESVGQNPYRVHWTALRTDVIHQTWRGDFYTTVYRFPANDFDTWIQTLNVCEPLVGAIAVGTTHLSLHDNNVTVAGGKSDSFGEVIVGSLSDRTSLCPGKKANYLLSYEAMVPTDGDGTWVIRHGVTSRLTCGY